jgi:hypothetical protein
MAQFFAESLRHVEHGLEDDSARVEAARKVSRRLRKLDTLQAKGSVVSGVSNAVQEMMRPVELRWRHTCEQDVRTIMDCDKFDFEQDVRHSLVNSKPILDSMLKEKSAPKKVKAAVPKCAARGTGLQAHLTLLEQLDKAKDGTADPEDSDTVLYDIENHVITLWERWEKTAKIPIQDPKQAEKDFLSILPLLKVYLSVADKVYKADMEGRSRLVLTAVTMTCLADRYACHEHSILSQHDIEIDPSMLNYLLLSRAREKKLLHSLEGYMMPRQKANVGERTGLLHPQVSETALSVRFASQCRILSSALENLDRLCEKEQQAKLQECDKLRAKHSGIERQIAKLQDIGKCKCDKNVKMDGKKDAWCDACMSLKIELSISANMYEKLLPESRAVRKALAFEMQMPKSLAHCRAVVYLLSTWFAYVEETDEPAGPEIVGLWDEEPRLQKSFKKDSLYKDVKLGFTTNVGTYYPKHITALTGESPGVVENIREAVVVDSATGEAMGYPLAWTVRDFLKIGTRDARYKSLHFSLETWNHTENHVLAQKCNSHPDLSLREFESFGCLRAGIRLQLPRLARSLAQQSLSFERRGVLDLVTCLLMQAGPPGKIGEAAVTGLWRRQAHELLGTQTFCDDLCAHAVALLEQNATNWTRHMLMLVIVSIGRCILHHAPDGQKALQLLRSCRQVSCDWIQSVRGVMQRSSDEEVQKLRLKVVDIAASAVLTYDSVCPALLQSAEDAEIFVWLRVVLSDNILLRNVKMSKIEPSRLNLLRKGLNVALELEERIHEVVGKTEALTAFVCRHWTDSNSGTCGKWKQHTANAKRWYEASFTGGSSTSVLQVDVLRGKFLVNGAPVGHLPESITSHEDYVRLFGDATFEVQPTLGGGWKTAASSNGVSYAFYKSAQTGGAPLIIEDRADNDGTIVQAQLVSHQHFCGDFPDALVEHYSHWLVLEGKLPTGEVVSERVFFRPARYDHVDFSHGCTVEGAPFILFLNNGHVVDTIQKSLLVDIKSKSFAELYDNIFNRVAPRSRVHVFKNPTGSMVVLPQLGGLQFHVEGNVIRSHEFGSRVSPNQCVGTLVGLRHGLLLYGPTGDRTLLMPHAMASRIPGSQDVDIQIDKLREPPLFVYKVREDLRELQGQKNRLAWLYLAKLHALTAHPLADPFLGRSGTAQALYLLGSGRCRGNLGGAGGWMAPLVDTTLCEIANLSVTRKLIKKTKLSYAERNNLAGHSLPSLCAHDGLAWVVNAMRQEAQQAARLARADVQEDKALKVSDLDSTGKKKDTSKKLEEEKESIEHVLGHLGRRAYLLSRDLYPPDARLSPEDESTISGAGEATLKTNDKVTVTEGIYVAADPPFQLKPGTIGVVSEIDPSGDARIAFKGFKIQQWIFQDDFSKLQKKSRAGEEVKIQTLAQQANALQSSLFRHDIIAALDRKHIRAVTVPLQNKRAVNTWADLDGLLFSSGLGAIKKLTGLTSGNFHLKSIADWENLVVEKTEGAVNQGGQWFPNVWLDLYEIARKGDIGGVGEESAKLAQLQFFNSWIVQNNLRHGYIKDHLVQLTTIAINASRFAEIVPPSYGSYDYPSESTYVDRRIDDTVNENKKPFDKKDPSIISRVNMVSSSDAMVKSVRSTDAEGASDEAVAAYHEAKATYDKELQQAKAQVHTAAKKAFEQGGAVREAMCKHPAILNPGSCASTINAYVMRWRRAAELKSFIRKVRTEIKAIQEESEAASTTDLDMGSQLLADDQLRPANFELSALQPEALDVTQEDNTAYKLGQYAKGRLLDSALKVPAAPKASTNSDLPIAAGREGKEVYERLLSPLREGWTLANPSERRVKSATLDGDLEAKMRTYLESAQRDTESMLSRFHKALEPKDDAGKALEATGLLPATVPVVLLPGLMSKTGVPETWRTALASLALLMKHQQRARRLMRLLARRDATGVNNELRNGGCDGWTPREFPEWLLLELDNDLSIRGQQAAVAKQVMSDEGGNRLLQLIMGAGKTAVIIPMVIASLANGERLVRTTVIGPLYATNAADWQLKLGGLLGRRVFPMVCRRELKLERHADEILSTLDNVRRNGHVIVTVPEYRLSLENKALELATSGDIPGSFALQEVLQFFASHGRDVLDESDEILHPKFQLIYSLGEPVDLDGRSMRWVVGAAVLRSVGRHAEALQAEFGHSSVEINKGSVEDVDNGLHQFPAVRLLEQAKHGAYAKLCELVCEDFLAGVHPNVPVLLKPDEASPWRRVVLEREAPNALWQSLSPQLLKLAFLLRGLLAHQVMYGALHKRWRVEFGGHPSGRRRMAVPYRAKDVAAEKTEFGHPDCALILTTIHYYHKGLSLDQLRDVLRRLGKKGITEAQATYAAWAQAAPSLTVRSWSGVNLDDSEQFGDLLLPGLYRHMDVINFWLDQVAFPSEAKQFTSKMVANAWDLCRSDTNCITTGFSGTDDAHLLLPLTVRQENMLELKETNSILLHNLFRKENDDYSSLSVGSTGQEILDRLGADQSVDVLLDAGALVLELSHKQTAMAWLEIRKDRKAAVYFEGDRIEVVDRLGLTMPLSVSPFEDSMGDCLLYLDEEHTRGSDFKLPQNRRAVVTLGKGMQKDKLLQAIMRMRQLGNGHCVSFMASFEADLQISTWRVEHPSFKGADEFKACAQSCGLDHLPAVLSWCLSNTVNSTCDRLLYVATQAAVQLRKRYAHARYKDEPAVMATNCAESEALTLEDLYGYTSSLERVPVIAERLMNNTVEGLPGGLPEGMVDLANKTKEHVRSLVPDVSRYSGLFEEEHERELEEEQEEEVEGADRPSPASPCEAQVSAGLMDLARSGKMPDVPYPLIPKVLTETSFKSLVNSNWDENVQVTPDFIHTVQEQGDKDSFLRPITWMLSIKGGPTVLISNFEAEQLHAFLLERKGKCTLNLVTPNVRLNQAPAMPSMPHHLEPPIAVAVFAGSIHGTDEFFTNVRAFLGLVAKQPASPVWRELFEQRGAIESDGFVVPRARADVCEQLGVEIGADFVQSPVNLLQCLYGARHLTEDLQTSPIGQLIGAADVCRAVKRPQLSRLATSAAAESLKEMNGMTLRQAIPKRVNKKKPKEGASNQICKLFNCSCDRCLALAKW